MIILLLVFLLINTFFTHTYELPYIYSQATKKDVPEITRLVQQISQKNPDDTNKVVILPETFIAPSINKAIMNQQLFIVRNSSNQIIGYKKLFVIENDDLRTILQDEIRCIGQKAHPVDSAFITIDGKRVISKSEIKFTIKPSDLFLYTGGDYIDPSYRNQGICTDLYGYSLSLLLKTVNRELYKRLIVTYGLTHFNDFDSQGKGKSRTVAIVISLREALQKYGLCDIEKNIIHHRFNAFMPRFVEKDNTCIPLSDEESIPGFGNLLIIHLSKEKK